MAYQINRYDNSLIATVEDGTIDQTTDLKLVGKNYAGYGEIQNENFLFLLENFAGANAPPRAISGQLWYDSSTSKLKFYDGTKFRTTGGSEIATTEPTGLTTGDFWWDTANDQLYVYSGSAFVLIGPQAAGDGVTQIQSRTIKDSLDVNHGVVVSVVDDEVITVISADEFTIKVGDPSAIDGFDVIKKGVTLKNTKAATSGVTSTDHYFWGTASNALRLGGNLASDYVLAGAASFTSVVNFADTGITIGDSQDLKIGIENGNEGFISNTVGSSNVIKFKANNGAGTSTHSVSINATGMVTSADSTYNLGTGSLKFANVYADTFDGTATQANTLKEGANYRSGDTSATANTVAVRTAAGNIAANLFQGTATSARYADLAEKYTTNGDLEPGTVVEVCAHDDHADHEVCEACGLHIPLGVVSTNPAVMMNSEAEGQYIALVGRVPVKVAGAVKKGQPVYASHSGVATVNKTAHLVGIALESNDDDAVKLVECVLKV